MHTAAGSGVGAGNAGVPYDVCLLVHPAHGDHDRPRVRVQHAGLRALADGGLCDSRPPAWYVRAPTVVCLESVWTRIFVQPDR